MKQKLQARRASRGQLKRRKRKEEIEWGKMEDTKKRSEREEWRQIVLGRKSETKES